MPRNQKSLRLTEAYRRRLFALRENLESRAPDLWREPDLLAASVEAAQKAACALTGAYLTAFLRSETGKVTPAIVVDTEAYSGSAADGQPLVEQMRSPLIGYFTARKSGEENPEQVGIDRAVRQVGMNYDAAHRKALAETIAADERFSGSARAVRGTCGACAALSGTPHMSVHPNCHCVEEPEVAGVSQRIKRPTGAELFNAKTPEEQDAMVGPEAAEKLRTGQIAMADLIGESHLDSDAENFLTQATA